MTSSPASVLFLLLLLLKFFSTNGSESDPKNLNKPDSIKYYHFPDTDTFVEIKSEKQLESIKLDKNEQTFVIIDGFLSSWHSNMSKSVTAAILKRFPSTNVILVDWNKMNGFESFKITDKVQLSQMMLIYNRARSNVKFVGQQIANLLNALNLQRGIEYSKIHLIGYSLGAHIAGVIGYLVIKDFNDIIGRITGLDPAGLGFPMSEPDKRLDSHDARFVDVFFTNLRFSGDFETHNVGHLQVFVNGGRTQPGCSSSSLIQTTICNHAFSWKTWNQCLEEKCVACPCTDADCQNCSGICSASESITVGIGEFSKSELDGSQLGDFFLKMDAFS